MDSGRLQVLLTLYAANSSKLRNQPLILFSPPNFFSSAPEFQSFCKRLYRYIFCPQSVSPPFPVHPSPRLRFASGWARSGESDTGCAQGTAAGPVSGPAGRGLKVKLDHPMMAFTFSLKGRGPQCHPMIGVACTMPATVTRSELSRSAAQPSAQPLPPVDLRPLGWRRGVSPMPGWTSYRRSVPLARRSIPVTRAAGQRAAQLDHGRG